MRSGLLTTVIQEVVNIDNDVKSKYTQYNQIKTNLTILQRKQECVFITLEALCSSLLIFYSGNLSNKSLTTIVPPNLIVQDSEYLETHLVAVPKQLARDFPKIYETISPWVVPRSAELIDSDDEFSLYAVTTFKKYSQEFIHKCREQRWTPRDYKFEEGGREKEQKELDKVAKEEKRLWGEALRLGRISWGEAVIAWVHVLALRVFVETVLRYGLPLEFVCGLVKVFSVRPLMHPFKLIINRLPLN